MLANIEYKLVRNNYVEMVNKPGLLVYRKKDDPIAQLTIKKDSDSYSLSFPLNNSRFNYSTSFADIQELKTYIENNF